MKENSKSKTGFIIGLIAAILVLTTPNPEGLPIEAQRAAAIFVWMAIWWATEAVHIAITALIPLVFFPLLGVASIEETSAPYANKNIYLFMGGFFLSIAIQKCNLHKRIALNVLGLTGTAGRSIIAGFMVSSCVLSMWIMNTSTTVMLLPIGLAIISVVKESMKDLTDTEKVNFQVALLLGIAYAANIGGIATLIGTAPNMALNGFMEEQYSVSISFIDWMKVGLPVSLTTGSIALPIILPCPVGNKCMLKPAAACKVKHSPAAEDVSIKYRPGPFFGSSAGVNTSINFLDPIF